MSEPRTSVRADPRGLKSAAHGSIFFALFFVPVHAAEVLVEQVDGQSFRAEWIGADNPQTLSFRSQRGLEQLPIESLAAVEFVRPESDRVETPSAPASKSADGSVVFMLADEGMIHGDLVGHSPSGVVAKTAFQDGLVLPFERLAGIRLAASQEFPKADEMWKAALLARLPGQDVLITRSAEEPKSVRGRLEELDAARGSFAPSDSSGSSSAPRSFSNEKIFGVVFATGARPAASHEVTFHGTDGSFFSGRFLEANAESLRIDASFGAKVDLPLERLTAIRFRSGRIVYLSDLSPSAERFEGRLHRPWPFQRDRNVVGGPLSLNGRRFAKGLGVHAYTELAYDLESAFEVFASTIGLDDSVRPRGSVVFQVFAETKTKKADGTADPSDRKLLFDSGIMTGVDAPRDVLIDLAGCARIILEVDYADEIDLGDRADWAGESAHQTGLAIRRRFGEQEWSIAGNSREPRTSVRADPRGLKSAARS